jgi:DHA1 family tetracycline resistance protein-like MFS transporter
MSQPNVIPEASTQMPTPPKGAMFTIFLIVFVDLLGFGLIIPLLPFYALKHNASPLQVELLFSVYSICQFVAAPILGMISDRFGRRPVLIVSQIGSVAGYLLLGWATQHQWDNLTTGLIMIYVSRVIDGLSGGNISTAQAYIADVTGPENRAKGMGLLGAAFGLGFVFGPGVGGVLGHVAASLPAYVAAFTSATAAVMTFILLKESRVHRPVDAESWLHPSRFKPILRKPVLVQLLLIWFCSMAAFVMMDASAAMFLKDIFNFNELHVGLYFAFVGIIIALVQGGLIGRLNKRAGEWVLCALGLLLVSFGACGTLATAWQPVLWLLGLGGIVTAAGRSLQQPTISSLVSKHADRNEQGVTMGLFQGLGSLARAFGPFVGGLAYGTTLIVHPIRPYLIASAILLLTSIWTWAIHDNPV